MLSIDRRPIMPGVTFIVSGMVLIIQIARSVYGITKRLEYSRYKAGRAVPGLTSKNQSAVSKVP